MSVQKILLKLNITSHNASSYTGTDGFLEHSASGESLYYKGPAIQKITLRVGGVPPLTYTHTHSDSIQHAVVHLVFHYCIEILSQLIWF